MAEYVKVMGDNPHWIKYIHNRISQNKNFLCLISGPTGSGKSWSAISIANLLNDDFNIDRVVFKGKDLMNLINRGNLPKKKGIVIVWDEAGIDLASRSWQSAMNKMLNFLLQTFRHRNIILIFTTPYSDFIDAQTRKLFHAEFKTATIDHKVRTTILKPYCIQYNSQKKQFYYKWLKVMAKGQPMVPVTKWEIPAPNKDLIKEYEHKKTLFTNLLNKEIESQLIAQDSIVQKKPLTDLQKKILKYWESGETNNKKISELLGKHYSQICENIRFMRRKGYIKENYENIKEKEVS